MSSVFYRDLAPDVLTVTARIVPKGKKAPEAQKALVEGQPVAWTPDAKAWATFFCCYLSGALGVWASFGWLGGSMVSPWVASVVIAAVMLSASYASKYSHEDSRANFSPLDLLHFFAQGLLWPTTWPTLAKTVGVAIIGGPRGY